MPLTEALSKEVNNILKGWEPFIDTEYVEDAIIDLLGRRRGGEEEKRRSRLQKALLLPSSIQARKCYTQKLSRSYDRVLREGLQLLREGSPNGHKPPDTPEGLWHSRLRPRPGPQSASRQQARNRKTPLHGVLAKQKCSKSSTSQVPITRVRKARVRPKTLTPPMASAPQHSPDLQPRTEPSAVNPRRAANTPSSERVGKRKIHSSGEGVQKTRKAE